MKELYRVVKNPERSQHLRPDIINMIVDTMEEHEHEYYTVFYASSCLMSLTNGPLADKIHPSLLKRLTKSLLNVLHNFPQYSELLARALFVLCSRRIVMDLNFDKNECTLHILEALYTFRHPILGRMCAYICMHSAPKKQKKLIDYYLLALQMVVFRKILDNQVDTTLEFALIALTNRTNVCPVYCERFVLVGGLKMCVQLLNTFVGVDEIEEKVLKLINNVAKIPILRHRLRYVELLEKLKKLVESRSVDVSNVAKSISEQLFR